MTYAVVACSRCRQPWAVELRQATASCPACAARTDLSLQRPLWQGDSPQEAQVAAAQARLALSGSGAQATAAVLLLSERPARAVPRHDSPLDAAAAQGAGIANRSERAEAVARALARLVGLVGHVDLVSALERAGLEAARAEAEVCRMLACDVLLEPRAGVYRALGPE